MHLITGNKNSLSDNTYVKLGIYRHAVFVEKLGWQLQTDGVTETDQFDRPDTIYIVGKEDNGDVVNCARLLPTTGPYLLSEVFLGLLNGLPQPSSPDVFELSRFSTMNVDGRPSSMKGGICDSTVRVLDAVMIAAAKRGAKRIITVTTLGIERLLAKTNYQFHRAGPPKMINGSLVIACWIDVPEDAKRRAKASNLKSEYS